MRKALTLMAVFVAFTASAAAIQVTDLTIDPAAPEINDTVDVESNVDSEGDYIERVRLTVYRNDTEILDTDMTLKSGERYSTAVYEELDAFGLINESATYYLTSTAVSSGGVADSESLIIKVDNGVTVIEDPDGDTDYPTIFGLGIDYVIALIMIGLVGYAIIVED